MWRVCLRVLMRALLDVRRAAWEMSGGQALPKATGASLHTLTPTPAPRPGPRLRCGRSRARAPMARQLCLLAPRGEGLSV
ncbi:hypothetical protein XacyCFBP1159_15650 [Xanthomonas arboricola pv. corylina]|nr:hypothetical protein XacyCFBP2565_17990 [Xanthomonas arboricola pv. corylina]PPU59384.1 hypothetical protein XacyCFBP1159_15650 [Xanthomonas arboricola pv. corylina]